MSMMWPPQRVKMTSIPSARSALATRWPPEIVSVSAPRSAGASAGTAVLVAVTSISSPFRPPRRDRYARSRGVQSKAKASGQRRPPDRALGPVVLPDHVAANRAHVHEQAGDQRADHGRAGEVNDALVEAQVRLRVLVQAQAQLVVLERGEERAQAADLIVGRSLAEQPGGHALERRPGSDHLGDLRLALAHDPDAPAGHDLHQPLVLEPGQCPAHGRAADA